MWDLKILRWRHNLRCKCRGNTRLAPLLRRHKSSNYTTFLARGESYSAWAQPRCYCVFAPYHGILRRACSGSSVYFYTSVGRDSSVGIGTRYGLDGPGIESRWWARFSAPVLGGHPSSCKMSAISLFPWVKPAEAWRSPQNPSTTEVKERVYLFLYSHYVL